MILEGTIRWDKSRVQDDDGRYTANFILDEENQQKLLEQCKEVALDKGAPYKPDNIVKDKTEKDGTHLTGYITAKSRQPVKVVDTARTELPVDVKIWNGSKCRVALNPFAYEYKGKKGISLGLNGIMVIEMAEKSAGGGDPFANLDEVEGFVADKSAVIVGDAAAADVFDDFEPTSND